MLNLLQQRGSQRPGHGLRLPQALHGVLFSVLSLLRMNLVQITAESSVRRRFGQGLDDLWDAVGREVVVDTPCSDKNCKEEGLTI